MEFSFSSELEVWEGKAAWYFVVVPTEFSEPIESTQHKRRGFGAVKVRATIGGASWETSIFPNSEDGTYLLFVKKQVREAENLEVGNTCDVNLKTI